MHSFSAGSRVLLLVVTLLLVVEVDVSTDEFELDEIFRSAIKLTRLLLCEICVSVSKKIMINTKVL